MTSPSGSNTSVRNLVPSRHLWIGRCHKTSKHHLERVFSNFGIIENVSYDKRDHFAFIDFLSVEAAERAFYAMEGAVVGARKVRLAFGRVTDDEDDDDDELFFHNMGEEEASGDNDDPDYGHGGFYYGGAFSTRETQFRF